MNRLLTLSLLLSAGIAGSQTAAFAQTKTTMHCNFVGTVSPEVLDAKQGHSLAANTISCRVEGGALDKGWVTGYQVYEFFGAKGDGKAGLGIMRHPNGAAVWITQTAGTELKMQEGKIVGWHSWGTGTYTMGAGVAKEMEGRTFSYVARPAGPGQATIETTIDDKK